MNETLAFEPFLLRAGWVAIRTQGISMRDQSLNHQKTLLTVRLERYIPLH